MTIQAAGTPAPAFLVQTPGEAQSLQLQKLLEAQAQSVVKTTDLQGELAAMSVLRDRSTGVEKEQAAAQVKRVESQLAGEKARLTELKARISELRKDIELTPGIATPPAPPSPEWTLIQEPRIFGRTKEEVAIGGSFLVAFPLVVTLSLIILNRFIKRHPQRTDVPDDRMARLEQAVESIAIEVERIGESQRFQTKLMSDRSAERVAVEPKG
jgi:hypothetical protein